MPTPSAAGWRQADALAYGKTADELAKEGVPPHLIPHKTFTGNRPSVSLLLPHLGAYQVGQLLSLYENKIATMGFIWGINSFDQWGVELGKARARADPPERTPRAGPRARKPPLRRVRAQRPAAL